ncbi:hypothetical protein OG225_43140 (plasmid) [Nocardia sp. NBC_01377]|uniref:hypothetical protein n=1 Tax=Nocardia sp. NBC_01377 TaxID=2903595 RepID=UPI002F91A69D
MKRPSYRVELYAGPDVIATGATKHAFNSAVRESERLAGEHARELGVILHGDSPTRVADTYERTWRHEDTAVIARVQPSPEG